MGAAGAGHDAAGGDAGVDAVGRSGVESGGVTVPVTLGVDGSLVFFGLVLLALAEVFRRGAELEDEQSLVV